MTRWILLHLMGIKTDQGKLPYEPPRLVVHGDLRGLTLGPASGSNDAIFGGNGGFDPAALS